MNEIKIKKNTSIDDINNHWCLDGKTKVSFVISKESSFELFAEGVALGFLKDFKLKGIEIEIKLNPLSKKIDLSDLSKIKSDSTAEYKSITEINIPEILCSIFGMQLMYQASGMTGWLKKQQGGIPEVDARLAVGACIWAVIQKNGGLLGDGKRQYLFSRHDYMVPQILRKTNHFSFPSPEIFRDKVTPIIKSLGNEKIEESEKKELVGSWLYHVSENAHEHGAVDVLRNDVIFEEYRGVLIEKLAFTNRDSIKNRGDLNEYIKHYIIDLFDNHGLSNLATITIATIMDGGAGIQNSFPSNVLEGTSAQKLNKAFLRGVTRRSYSKKEAGYGLFDTIRITKKIKACVVISTGDLLVVKSFNDIKNDEIDLSSNASILNKINGTSFSVMWPSVLKADVEG